jgi:hypothetical protein
MTVSQSSPLPPNVQAIAGEIDLAACDPSAVQALYAASQGDPVRFQRYLKRHTWGDPVPYIIEAIEFRQRTFKLDRRAYITDPELTHLVDAVLQTIDAFTAREGRSPLVAEFGVGCGSLSISIKLERPDVEIVGVEIDHSAIALARENAAQFGVDIPIIESDFFTSWSRSDAPDIIYGDPPWGETTDLYDDVRSADYYHAMPVMSAYPVGGKAAVHEGLLRHVQSKGWTSLLLLNCGVLPNLILNDLEVLTCTATRLHPAPELTILRCTVNELSHTT